MYNIEQTQDVEKKDIDKIFLFARWVLLITAICWVIYKISHTSPVYLAIFLLVPTVYLIFLIIYTIRVKQKNISKRLFFHSLFFDIFIISILLIFTGFEDSFLYLLYFPVIAGAGLKFKFKENIHLLFLIIIFYSGIIFYSYFVLKNDVILFNEIVKIGLIAGVSLIILCFFRGYYLLSYVHKLNTKITDSLANCKNFVDLPVSIFDALTDFFCLNGVFLIIKTEKDMFDIYDFSDVNMDLMKENKKFDKTNSLVNWTDSCEDYYINNNIGKSYNFAEEKVFLSYGFKSCLILPLSSDNESFGCLLLLSKKSGSFNEKYIPYLSIFINEVTSVLQRLKLRDEIKTKDAELKKSFRDVKKVDESKKKFISLVSHEFYTPLTSVLNSSELLLYETSSNSKDYELIRDIYYYGRRLHTLINKVIFLTKIENNQFEILDDVLNVNDLLSKILSDIEYYINEKSIKIDFKSTSKPIFIKGDEHKLSFAIEMILDNAVKYSPENEIVFVNLNRVLEDGKDKAIIEIIDRGSGINKENIKNIYSKFYENRDLKHHEEGLGIGLFLTKCIVEIHYGSIQISSIRGTGTKCTIKLPIISD